MASQWFYKEMGGKQVGPVSGEELRNLARRGVISWSDTPVRKAPDGAWVPANRVRGLLFSAPGIAPPPVSSAPPPPPVSVSPGGAASGKAPAFLSGEGPSPSAARCQLPKKRPLVIPSVAVAIAVISCVLTLAGIFVWKKSERPMVDQQRIEALQKKLADLRRERDFHRAQVKGEELDIKYAQRRADMDAEIEMAGLRRRDDPDMRPERFRGERRELEAAGAVVRAKRRLAKAQEHTAEWEKERDRLVKERDKIAELNDAIKQVEGELSGAGIFVRTRLGKEPATPEKGSPVGQTSENRGLKRIEALQQKLADLRRERDYHDREAKQIAEERAKNLEEIKLKPDLVDQARAGVDINITMDFYEVVLRTAFDQQVVIQKEREKVAQLEGAIKQVERELSRAGNK